MHYHGTTLAAQKCSRYCLANYQERAYWERHGHTRIDAPVKHCLECENDAKRAEESRYHAA